MKPKYRVGKKNKVAILLVETGEEYLVFPQAKKERVEEYCRQLNNANYLRQSLNRLSLVGGFIIGYALATLIAIVCNLIEL